MEVNISILSWAYYSLEITVLEVTEFNVKSEL